MDMMEGSSQHHVCNVCGEWFEEALALLAHAELHARYDISLIIIKHYRSWHDHVYIQNNFSHFLSILFLNPFI